MLGIALVAFFYLVEWLDRKSFTPSVAEGATPIGHLELARTLRPALLTASSPGVRRAGEKPAAPRALHATSIEAGGLPARASLPKPQAARSGHQWPTPLGDRPQEESASLPAASR